MDHALHGQENVAGIDLTGHEFAGGQRRVGDSLRPSVAFCFDQDVVFEQSLEVGAGDDLHAAVLGGGRDERDPEIDDEGLAGFGGDEVGEVLVPGDVQQVEVGHFGAQGELGVGQNFGSDERFGGVE